MDTSDSLRDWEPQQVLRPEPIRPASADVPCLPVVSDATQGKATATTTTGGMLVQRPVNYVLDFLPNALGSRVVPLYKNWAEPAVKKVDATLFAAAGTGARIVGDAKQRIFPAKDKSEASPSKPGLLTRGLMAAERVVQRALPLQSDEKTADDEMLEGSVSVFQRSTHLFNTIRHRSFVHIEVKYITTKVKAKVWYDLNLKPPAEAVCAKVLAVRNYGLGKVLALRDRTQAFTNSISRSATTQTKKVRDFGADRLAGVKAICDKSYTRTATTTRAFSNSVTLKATNLKDAISTRTSPLVERMQLLLKPLTDRLTAILKTLTEQRQKALAKAMAKKTALAGKARATFEPAQEYVAAKYDKAKLTAGKMMSPNMKAQ